MKNYISYTAIIKMQNNENKVKEMKIDHPDIKTLKENIKFVFNANRAEYNGEYSIGIGKYLCGYCGEFIRIESNDYIIKGNRLYKI